MTTNSRTRDGQHRWPKHREVVGRQGKVATLRVRIDGWMDEWMDRWMGLEKGRTVGCVRLVDRPDRIRYICCG